MFRYDEMCLDSRDSEGRTELYRTTRSDPTALLARTRSPLLQLLRYDGKGFRLHCIPAVKSKRYGRRSISDLSADTA